MDMDVRPIGSKDPTRETFLTLDGLRGLAAMLVVFHHQHLAGINNFPDGAYLAVDLFFLMSGFVIAHAYERRLAAGLQPLAFMRLRLIRLYPLYLFGSAIGLAVAIAFGRLSQVHLAGPIDLLRAAVCALGFIPYFSTDPTVNAFPLNGPGWSLFFELAVNLVYAVFAVRLSTRALGAVIFGSALLLGLFAWQAGDLNLGFRTLGFVGGLPRVSVSFFGGVLLYRLHAAGRLPKLGAHPLCAILAAMLLLTLPISGTASWIAALALVMVGFPALLILAVTSSTPSPGVARMFGWLGELSYPLYSMHGPLIVGLAFTSAIGGVTLSPLQPGLALMPAPSMALLALVLSRVYDHPVRQWLSRQYGAVGSPLPTAART